MRDGALQPYEDSLLTAGELQLITDDGRSLALDVARWLAVADASDHTVLARCVGPVLDVGCGPGRFVRALSELSIPCLGVDIAETAVVMTRGLGVPALLRNVFGPIPAEGRWPTVLLMDGNVGIGGDPRRLLARVARLLGPGGRLVVEVDPGPETDTVLTVRFASDGEPVGPSFEWAEVGFDALCDYAEQARFYVEEAWSTDGRTFVSLLSRLTLVR
jgi:SAM-dependent methyltransferase